MGTVNLGVLQRGRGQCCFDHRDRRICIRLQIQCCDPLLHRRLYIYSLLHEEYTHQDVGTYAHLELAHLELKTLFLKTLLQTIEMRKLLLALFDQGRGVPWVSCRIVLQIVNNTQSNFVLFNLKFPVCTIPDFHILIYIGAPRTPTMNSMNIEEFFTNIIGKSILYEESCHINRIRC